MVRNAIQDQGKWYTFAGWAVSGISAAFRSTQIARKREQDSTWKLWWGLFWWALIFWMFTFLDLEWVNYNFILMYIHCVIHKQSLIGFWFKCDPDWSPQDALFLRDLVMEGEWADVLEYLNPLRENTNYNKVRLTIEKQRFQIMY